MSSSGNATADNSSGPRRPVPLTTTTTPTPRPRPPRLRVSRVAQLDAQLLDDELENILHEPVKSALALIPRTSSSSSSSSWEPELLAVLRLTILKLSLWSSSSTTNSRRSGGRGGDASTYGSRLQNLTYRNEAAYQGRGTKTAIDSRLTLVQKSLYTLLVVVVPYVSTRVSELVYSSSWSDEPLPRTWLSLVDPRRFLPFFSSSSEEERIEWKREWKRTVVELVRASEHIANLLTLSNLLVFLYNGTYRSLIDRILRMRLVYAAEGTAGTPNVSFEFLNRQLVWEAFTEFLLFLMPLINLRRLKLRLMKRVAQLATSIVPTKPASSSRNNNDKSDDEGEEEEEEEEEEEDDDNSIIDDDKKKTRTVLGPPKTTKKKTRRRHGGGGKLGFLDSTVCPICYAASSSSSPPATRLPTSAVTTTRPSSSSGTGGDPTNPSSSSLLVSHHHHQSSSSTTTTLSDVHVKLPYVTNCRQRGRGRGREGGQQCRYCYYCIVKVLVQAEDDVEPGWECLRCGEVVTECRREEQQREEEEEEVVVDNTRTISDGEEGEEAEEEEEEGSR
ncbi:hypothetical protein JCM3766R1_002304 [Sporobolomyces carnicolor]